KQRITTLGLDGVEIYRQYLHDYPKEWQILDQLCRVTVTRFNRDKVVFQRLVEKILPDIIIPALNNNFSVIRVWSAGCASGEEPYTLKLYWEYELAVRFPAIKLNILATDVNKYLLQRAKHACYQYSSIKRLPEEWRERSFIENGNQYCLNPDYQQGIDFRFHDIREPLQEESFHIILCRNLAFTYFDEILRQKVLLFLYDVLRPDGFLILGAHEHLGDHPAGFSVYSKTLGIYQKQKADFSSKEE
ncbi:MAG: chemotaxis protein CheR, partial [Gammaproteobacteria bacterium]|nr:chemotaxis protein CheR [Gammaproteobacteria bacterium]